jgi:aminopeptidase N
MKYFLVSVMLLLSRIPVHAQTVDTLRIDLDTLTVSAPPARTPYQPSATLVWDVIHTRIALTFDRKEKTATAREWIILRPYAYATDTLVLDAKGMRIDSVALMWMGKLNVLNYTYQNDELKIRFDKKYAITDTVTVYLRYTAMPYAHKSGGSSAIHEDRGLYFINTDGRTPGKPAHIWTQGETESNSNWMVTIDKPNTRFTTQLELTVPDSLTTLSNGALVKQTKVGPGLRTDIWKMDMPIQPYAVMMAIGKYAVIRDKWNSKEVSYYVEPEYAPFARQMFDHTTEMMTYFSKATGVPYPWNKYSQVVVRDYVSGAMENTTASLFGEYMNQNAREIADKDYEDVVAHELFHQWFGDYVTCESWSNTTVNESFANFGEQLWREYKYGIDAADELAWKDLQQYLASSRGNDPQLVRYKYDNREEVFDAISYNKGGSILRYLRHLIGAEAFGRAMQLYLTQNALKPAEAHHWRLAVEEATGRDWNWFFDQWYYHAGHPVLKVNYTYNDTTQLLTVEVTQTQEDSTMLYTLPLTTAVIYGNQVTSAEWHIHRQSHTYTYVYKDGVRPVVIPDVLHVLPGEIKENKKSTEWLVQYMAATDGISRRLAVQAATKQISDSVAQVIVDKALNDKLHSVRRYALGQLGRLQSDKYKKRWTGKVTDLAQSDRHNLVRAEAIETLGNWKVKAAQPIFLLAIWDSSYAVAGNALEALNKQNNDTAYKLALMMSKTDPKASLETAVYTIIAAKGATEDVPLLASKAKRAYGTDAVQLSLMLNNYLKNTKDDNSFETAVAAYVHLIVYETSTSSRSTCCSFFFQAVTEQKNKLKDDNKETVATATTRLAILKQAADKILSEEQEEELKTKFEKLMKENFE